MSPRKLYADHGRRGELIKTPEQQVLVDALMAGLIDKAECFLDGKYQEPTAEELTAVRKTLQLRRKDAATMIGVSLRTWISRESGDGKSGMPAPEFAMLTLFLLRSTAYWGRLAQKLQADTTAKSEV